MPWVTPTAPHPLFKLQVKTAAVLLLLLIVSGTPEGASRVEASGAFGAVTLEMLEVANSWSSGSDEHPLGSDGVHVNGSVEAANSTSSLVGAMGLVVSLPFMVAGSVLTNIIKHHQEDTMKLVKLDTQQAVLVTNFIISTSGYKPPTQPAVKLPSSIVSQAAQWMRHVLGSLEALRFIILSHTASVEMTELRSMSDLCQLAEELRDLQKKADSMLRKDGHAVVYLWHVQAACVAQGTIVSIEQQAATHAMIR